MKSMYDAARKALTGDEHVTEAYPNLGLSVWIEGTCFLSGAVAMLARAGCYAAEVPAEADLFVFLGGEDVDPKMYGERALPGTWFNEARDRREAQMYQIARDNDIPIFGICRGMQFIHVMNGGKLYQHVYMHGAPHKIKDELTGIELMTSSMHHQMCIYPSEKGREAAEGAVIPVAFASPSRSPEYVCGNKSGGETIICSDTIKELEAAYYPSLNAFCVQGHPELGDDEEYTAWCLNHLQAMIDEMGDKQTAKLIEDQFPSLVGE